jgi:hypothetical protein
MADRDTEQLDRQIDRISDQLPRKVGGFLRWFKGPSSRSVRIPAGLLLITFGLFGFLPVLGFWMVPLGALLLAHDVPVLRRPMLQLLGWLEGKWTKWKGQPK